MLYRQTGGIVLGEIIRVPEVSLVRACVKFRWDSSSRRAPLAAARFVLIIISDKSICR